MQALMKLSRGNATLWIVNCNVENFSPPPDASLIRGLRKAEVSPPTTPAKAAPMTTPTAISTTLPRRMNFLKPSSMGISFKNQDGPIYDRRGLRASGGGRDKCRNPSATKPSPQDDRQTTRMGQFMTGARSSAEGPTPGIFPA